MFRCPRCSTEAPDASRFCPSCGSTMAPPSSAPTRTHLDSESPAHPSLDQARFTPGDVLANRYRITNLLGRGGMGEVYRADDLKLGQPVALKFLPAELEQDQKRLDRFLNEVRVARQVAHPNVCRMYDVAETGKQHFLSMEYVDGEDLASLLRRIGRLPEDKATQLARQVCAGLAAAHQQGILHRDLKPANIMIDGRGRARITDFGLAGLAESFESVEITAGTPAYMSPEQLEGREVTQRSDVYALGLVLYELFTGKPAFTSDSLTQIRQTRQQSTPTDPTSLVKGLDPAIEHIVLKCLDPDPAKRPADALAVSAALPGGDPLAAALAAGETPSPEMVAAAGDVGALKPVIAGTLLAATLLGLFAIIATHDSVFLPAQLDLPQPPEALNFKSREIIEDAGYPDTPVDRAHGFVLDEDRLQYARDNEGASGNWDPLIEQHPGPVRFWYRESPRYMSPTNFQGMAVSEMDPVPIIAGMTSLRLDPQGRLLRFVAIPAPPADPDSPNFNPSITELPPTDPDWTSLFEHAGLAPASMTATEPRWIPPVFCDTLAAWTGSFPDQPGTPVRIEAGAYRNKPVYFELVMPWTQAQQTAPEPVPLLVNIISFGFLLFLLAGAVLLARNNVRLGRGDRRGAFRLGLFMFVLSAIISIFGAHHTPTFAEAGLFFKIIAWGLMTSGMVWLAYLAIEPYARRLWPDILISWSRLLGGRLRDPLIGRDLLIGGVAGVVGVLIRRSNHLLPSMLGRAQPEPISGPMGGFTEGSVTTLNGVPDALAVLAHSHQLTLANTLAGIVLLVLLRLILRKAWIAIAGAFVFVVLMSLTVKSDPVIGIPVAVIGAGIYVGVLVRFGVLASSMVFMTSILDTLALPTLDFSNWYAGRSMLFVLLTAAIFGYAFYISLGGKPVLAQPD